MTMDVYTTTLTSGKTLVITQSADFGEIIITGLAVVLLAVVTLKFVHRLVYRG